MGTAFVDVGEKEPTQGRVLVFQITDSKHKIEIRLQRLNSFMCMLIHVHVSMCVCGGGGGEKE